MEVHVCQTWIYQFLEEASKISNSDMIRILTVDFLQYFLISIDLDEFGKYHATDISLFHNVHVYLLEKDSDWLCLIYSVNL